MGFMILNWESFEWQYYRKISYESWWKFSLKYNLNSNYIRMNSIYLKECFIAVNCWIFFSHSRHTSFKYEIMWSTLIQSRSVFKLYWKIGSVFYLFRLYPNSQLLFIKNSPHNKWHKKWINNIKFFEIT